MSADRLPFYADRLPVIDLGEMSYAECREFQTCLIEERLRGRSEDVLLYVSHPPTLTLGLRTKSEDIGLRLDEWKRRAYEVFQVRRGGGPTIHLPGQLVVYPIFSLKENKIGVKQFVEKGLLAFATALTRAGLRAVSRLQPAGVWVGSEREPFPTRKIAAVGLRIQRGVTDHGFSLNLSCALEPFRWFSPCGLPEAAITSVKAEGCEIPEAELKGFIAEEFRVQFPSQFTERNRRI